MMEGPRACRPEEFEETLVLLNSIFRPGSDQTLQTDYPLIFRESQLRNMRIMKQDGRVVAHVPVAPREVIVDGDRFTLGIISPTGTHPDYRRRGHGTRCLRDCLRLMVASDWPVSTLWTREATFPFYQHSGFEPVGSQARGYALSPEDRALFPQGAWDITLYNPRNPDHLDDVMRLHDTERLRIGRTREEYAALFTLPKMTTLLAMERGRAGAYLIVTRATNKPSYLEGGGDPAALTALFHQALAMRDAGDSAFAVVPLNPTVFGDALESRMPGASVLDTEAGGGFQMMRVNSLYGLLSRITGHLRARGGALSGSVCLVCADDGESVTLAFGGGDVEARQERSANAVELSRRQLARLIFGAHPAADPVKIGGEAGEMLDALFPFYFPIWGLDHS